MGNFFLREASAHREKNSNRAQLFFTRRVEPLLLQAGRIICIRLWCVKISSAPFRAKSKKKK